MTTLGTRGTIRNYSTRSIVDKWFNAIQSCEHDEQQKRLTECVESIAQENKINYPKLIQNIIHRWTIEQPSKDALWTYENDGSQGQKFTFSEIYTQSTDFARILTGKQFNLTVGENILVLLPPGTKERLLLQLACLQNQINFFSFDSSPVNTQTIFQRIRTLAIDCIITNDEYFDMIMNCTYNTIRPLKKGLITKQFKSQPLPVGWYPVMTSSSSVNNKELSNQSIQMKISSSQAKSSLHHLQTAYWLNTTKTPHLIWIKNNHDQVSLAAWLLGSTIFFNEISNPQTIIETLKIYPIDTLCLSKSEYELVNKQTQHDIHVLCAESPIIDMNMSRRFFKHEQLC